MLITRISPWSGKRNSRDLPVTQEQMDRFARRETVIQNIFPNLSAGDREYLFHSPDSNV